MTFSTLPPEARQQARRLYRKLLLFYIGVTLGIFSLSAIALYTFVSRSLYQQHQEELKVLAEAAAPSLDLARQRSKFFSPEANAEHWHTIEQHSQSLEWFDADGELLVREGRVFPNLSLPDRNELSEGVAIRRDRQQQLQVVTLPVYEAGNLAGIVRASESLRIIERPLRQLRWGLLVRSVLGLCIIVPAGIWLSRLAIKPFRQSYQRLRQFTADASHEMRSPLAVIQAGLDVMLERTEPIITPDRTSLTNMDSAAKQLRNLTEALLQLARLDRPAVKAQQLIPLHELLQDLVDAMERIADECGLQLTYSHLAAVTVRGDNALLVQLFSNLLQNGIQYTPRGGRVIVALSQTGKHAIVTITDTGIGIASEDLLHVFERFWRADKARSRQQGGLGLGLAIAYDIAKRYRGDICVRSQVGRGSTFEVRLPQI
ncbi:sensor histidine kinase [Myxosarcina sp. GI1(2024)]